MGLHHDVFISYSSHDKEIAEAVCCGLERKGIQCWIAPRDVLPGTSFEESIIKAINDSSVFVLVFTATSSHSSHVENEVRLAWRQGMAIVPFRLDDVPLSDIMNYYIGSRHWLDATKPPLDQNIGRLVEDVEQLLHRRVPDAVRATMLPAAKPAQAPATPVQRAAARKATVPLLTFVVAVIAILIIAVALMSGDHGGGPLPTISPGTTLIPADGKELLMAPPGSIAVSAPAMPDSLSGFKIRVIGGVKPDVTVTMDDMRNMSFVRIENVEKSLLNGNSYIADYTGVPVMAIVQAAGMPGGNVSFQVISQDGYNSRFTLRQLEYSIIAFYQNEEINEADIDSKKAIKLVPMGLPGAEFWVKMPKEIRISQA